MIFKKLAWPVPHLHDAALFELSEPFTWSGMTTSYVVASWDRDTADDEAGSYHLFPCDRHGHVTSWANLADGRGVPDWVFKLGYIH